MAVRDIDVKPPEGREIQLKRAALRLNLDDPLSRDLARFDELHGRAIQLPGYDKSWWRAMQPTIATTPPNPTPSWPPWAWALLGVGGVGLLWALAAWMRRRELGAAANPTAINGSSSSAALAPAELGRQLAARYLVPTTGCTVEYQPGQGPGSFALHVQDWIQPAAAAVRAQQPGADVDAITRALMAQLKPGCSLPEQLEDVDLERAVANEAPFAQQQVFNYVRSISSYTQLYLLIRGLVASSGGAA